MTVRPGFIAELFLSAVLSVALCQYAASGEDVVDTGCLLWISDIHFDPFAGGEVVKLADDSKTDWRDHSEWGAILAGMPANAVCAPAGSDANNFLYRKVLDGAAAKLPRNPDCILITGDFLAHNFDASYFSRNHLPVARLSDYGNAVQSIRRPDAGLSRSVDLEGFSRRSGDRGTRQQRRLLRRLRDTR
jgi:hypothetical protein